MMDRTVELIVPTLGRPHLAGFLTHLRFLPFPVRIHVIKEGDTWAKAVNIGLREIDPANDVLLMDDDVFIRPNTFALLQTHYNEADIFGFKLLFPDGRVQHAGGVVFENGAIGHIGYGADPSHPDISQPLWVCHVTTSLAYIKAGVIQDVGEMAEDIPGVQMEDVDFSFRALKCGKKILYLPGEAVHLESATKRTQLNFKERMGEALEEVSRRHLTNDTFLERVRQLPQKMLTEVVS